MATSANLKTKIGMPQIAGFYQGLRCLLGLKYILTWTFLHLAPVYIVLTSTGLLYQTRWNNL